jgi:hypothetical protein
VENLGWTAPHFHENLNYPRTIRHRAHRPPSLERSGSPYWVLSEEFEPVSVFGGKQVSGSDQLAPFEKSGIA